MSRDPNSNLLPFDDLYRREILSKPETNNIKQGLNLRDDLRDLEYNLGLHRGGADSPLSGPRSYYRLDPRALQNALLKYINRHGDNSEYYSDDDDSENEGGFSEIDGLGINISDDGINFANNLKPTIGSRLYNGTKRAVSKIRENICLGRSTTPENEIEQLYRQHGPVAAGGPQPALGKQDASCLWSLSGVISIERPSSEVQHNYSRNNTRITSGSLARIWRREREL
ncbi:hypothetical protein V1517DRAFT_321844 [Lipomyces orientalis]|uniref:Uncharacterized protein n=1 Tax=Lipomyces orientalis TaxID=1233043 RepID=A0ACC3TPY7_9ASCO